MSHVLALSRRMLWALSALLAGAALARQAMAEATDEGAAAVEKAVPPVHDLWIFNPASPAAGSIVNLAILVLAIAGLIFLVVEGVLFYTIVRFRKRATDDDATEPPQVYGSQPIEVAWTAAPAVIVLFLVLVTTRTLWEVNASPVSTELGPAGQASAGSPGTDELVITVVGRQWWWEYRYDEYRGQPLGFITANELHIPAGDGKTARPVRLNLESADVVHSFWVPRLEGKVDLIPGRRNTLWLQTKQPGLYLGQCAEYCGTQHAHMLLRVVVDTPEDFERWLAAEAKPAVEDAAQAEGKQAFLGESCVNCHRVRGTPAKGTYGPDLTHVMSRQTLASGMLENNEENLGRWVRDPQSIKPGCLMPAFGLSTQRHDLIVRYLMTLH